MNWFKIEKMKNSNKIKRKEELLLGVPILVGFLLAVHFSNSFWAYVMIFVAVTYLGLLDFLKKLV